MHHHEDQFSGADTLPLYQQNWLPDGTPRAVFALVHGYNDHSGRYPHLVNEMVRRRMAVYSYDLRGHGRSAGQRGHVRHFDDFRQDTHRFIELVKAQHPRLPFFLFGHSLGGLIVLDQALQYPQGLDGVIASAPHLGNPPISPLLATLSKIMSGVWPGFSMNAGLDATALSRDESISQAYLKDPLLHGKGTARLAVELSKAVAETQAAAPRFTPPLLMYQGTADRLTQIEASRQFYDNVQSKDKTFISYDGGYHENHNDIHHERVTMEVAQWVESEIAIVSQQRDAKEI
jgi:alpha-beta hydrolase superfamily lysophospholipase